MSPATDLFYFVRAQRGHLSDEEAAEAWHSLSTEQRRAFEYRLCKSLAELLDEQEQKVACETFQLSDSRYNQLSGASYDDSEIFLMDPNIEHNFWRNTPNIDIISRVRKD